MKNRRTKIFLALVVAFLLTWSVIRSLETQAGEADPSVGEKPAGFGVPLPDLIVSRVEVLSMTATSLEYRFVVENIGDAAADIDGENPEDPFDNVNFQSILSQDNVLGGMDDRGGGGGYLLAPSELAPGEEYTYTFFGDTIR